MTAASLLLFSGVFFVAAATPGPSIAAIIARVLASGTRGTLPFLLGLWLGDAGWLTAAVAGLSAIAEAFSPVLIAIKWGGVVYLAYLAWKLWNAAPGASETAPPRRSSPALFFTGISVSLGNPKSMMFYLALLPSIVDMQAVSAPGWLELVACQFSLLMVVNTTWMLAAARARRCLTCRHAVRTSYRISSFAMASAAAAIASR